MAASRSSSGFKGCRALWRFLSTFWASKKHGTFATAGVISHIDKYIYIYMHQFSQPLPPPLPHGPRSCPLPPVVWGGLGLVVGVVVGLVVAVVVVVVVVVLCLVVVIIVGVVVVGLLVVVVVVVVVVLVVVHDII